MLVLLVLLVLREYTEPSKLAGMAKGIVDSEAAMESCTDNSQLSPLQLPVLR